MAATLFAAASALLVWSWNRCFTRVPLRIAAMLWLACAAYLAPTLFTSRVDVPANLAFVAYPWKATGQPAVKANTGIVFTQIAPWTRVARDALRDGEMPLWNRNAAAGAPLLANQQTAIFHPFTLLGLLLPLGKAFTLSAALRLFAVAFFTFVLLTQFGIGETAATFGALAFTFCTFNIIWLLFPLGLATMMLPACLASAYELAHDPRPSAYVALVIALSCSILGGHPESALWVWIVTAGFCAFLAFDWRVALAASAFIVALMLTAFFWLPTLRALQVTSRYQAMQSLAANPADHGLTYEWLLPLVAPNIRGNPVDGTYAPPRGSHPAVLNDYGEVASGYAGLTTLVLALAAPFVARRRRNVWFAVIVMTFSLLTIAETPVWRDVLRAIPLVGISLHQRLRGLWAFGVCVAGAFSLDAIVRNGSHRTIIAARAAIVLVVVELVAVTCRYNPSAATADVFPEMPVVRAARQSQQPFRIAAAGWSLLPDTPSYYGLEDIKTTDPIQHAHYMRLLKGYLHINADSYDLVIGDYTQPFFDFLNIRYVYVPPEQRVSDPRFTEVYRGADGVLLENTGALPRYFLVPECWIEPDFGRTVWRSKEITDFRRTALVDHVPGVVRKAGLDPGTNDVLLANGTVDVIRYGANSTELAVKNESWALLATSDVHWPGWRVYVNGRRVPPVTVNGAFVGSFIPPGGGRVLLRYRPDEYDHGLRLLGAGVVLLAAVAGVMKLRSRSRARA